MGHFVSLGGCRMIIDYLNKNGWDMVDTQKIESREKQLFSHKELNVSKQAKLFLEEFYPDGLYMHQKEALKGLVDGQNACMLTGTASGKSMVFYAKGIDMLVQNHDARIIAIYPLKALGREQETKWAEALKDADMGDVMVGRIDGDIHVSMRKGILKKCKVVIMTPDIIHTWLLSNIGDRDIVNFLLKVSLIIVDEVHTYTGVFGSNAAYLFRRIRHLLVGAGKSLQFICASATMANPQTHLNNLFGVPFTLIGEELDTSPKHEVEIILLAPPRKGDFLTEVTKLIKYISVGSERFIAFIDSRKQTELISSILARKNSGEEETDSTIIDGNPLETLNILPYRAGYEETDQQIIQQRLSQGLLKVVISTSALELGLDIPHLGIAILIGVPYSATSLLQRIGRIGRHGKGTVYIIHSGSFLDEVVFKNPERLRNRPLGESALYLNNPRVQYIHALCLARLGGEHDQLCNVLGKVIAENDFKSSINWPDGFISLCKSERIGEITPDLQAMKAEAGDDPNHTYPLRDVESQFRVQLKRGPVQEDKGSLSYSQLLREAYPGAVYYYATQAFRVHTVRIQSRLVYVRPEKRYTTSPKSIPTQVFPNLISGNIYNARNHDELVVLETNIQVRESVTGFKEKRGSRQPDKYNYPLSDHKLNIYYNMPRFTRNYFTSGVILTHPSLDSLSEPEIKTVVKLVYEAFLMSIPFERQDINHAYGRYRINRPPFINENSRFIAIYDQTYGSLRLSGYVMQENLMIAVFEQALEIANLTDYQDNDTEEFQITSDVLNVIEVLLNSAKIKSSSINPISLEPEIDKDTDRSVSEQVIKPGSIGLALRNNNQEYLIENLFFNPKIGQLCYRGRYLSQHESDSTKVIWFITDVVPIPGESQIGIYDYTTGEVK